MNSDSIKRKIFSGLFWKFGERMLSQSVSLIISIVLARLLSPSDYGAVALVMVFITIANVFVVNGLGTSLIQKKNADDIDFSSVFYINLIISIILYIVIFISAPYISAFYQLPVISPALRVLGIQIIIAAVNSIQQAYVSKKMLFKKFFWSTFVGTLLSGIVGIIMAYQHFGVWSLVFQYLINSFLGTLVLWFSVRWRPKLIFSWKRSAILISYGWKLLVSALIDTGYNQLRSLIIGKVYASTDLAYYNQGDKYPNLIVININTSISSVLFPAMSMVQNNRKSLKEMTRKAIQISSYIMWPLMIGLCVTADSLISILLTEKWLPCVPYLRILCLSYGFWPIHTANLQALNALGRSDLYLKLEIIKKIIGMIALLFSIPFGPLAFAWSLLFVSIVSTLINAMPNIKLLKYRYVEQLKDLIPSLILSILMGIIVYPFIFVGLSNVLTLFVQVFVGMISYVILSALTKQKSLYYLIEITKKMIFRK